MNTSLQLRDYQEKAIKKIESSFEKGIHKQIAVLATGLGKTVIFSHLASQRIAKNPKKVLIIAHREELLLQAKAKLIQINPRLKVGIEQAEKTADHSGDEVIIASVATIGKAGSPRLLAFDPKNYHTIIIDEAHHASAESYRAVLAHFGVLKDTVDDWNTKILLLGVTATPNRTDNQGIDQIFDEVTYEYSIIDGIANSWLSRIKALRVSTDVSLDAVHEIGGDFSVGELANAVNTSVRNDLITKTYQNIAQGKQALVFASDVQHAHDLFESFKNAGINAGVILGTTDKEERRELLKKFASKQIHVMINAMVLTEGYDNASIEFIFMARPTKSGVLYHQMVGRGTRIHPGKEYLMIVDFVDNTSNHKLQTSSSLLGIEGTIDFNGEDILLYKSKLDSLREKRPFYDLNKLNVRNIESVLEEVDLFTQEEEKRIATPFQWHKFGDTFRIGIGDKKYFVIEQSLTGQFQLSKWNITLGTRSFIGIFTNRSDAVKQADYLVAQGFGTISNPGFTQEAWQKDIPTEAQIQLLRELGVTESELVLLDKGGASRLISSVKLYKKRI